MGLPYLTYTLVMPEWQTIR